MGSAAFYPKSPVIETSGEKPLFSLMDNRRKTAPMSQRFSIFEKRGW
ncbi:hypothetical protein B4113_2807 [Geobacillus sp. B4113_201601]|nr:hypothetical protein B4113_2807 [Geobacillus sp. B4113_201601]